MIICDSETSTEKTMIQNLKYKLNKLCKIELIALHCIVKFCTHIKNIDPLCMRSYV